MTNLRKQEPLESTNWLYKDTDESSRQFTKLLYLGVNDVPWSEGTDAEKIAWEEEHRLRSESEELITEQNNE